MNELAKLSHSLQADVDEFLRKGGKVTQLDYAGVPVDGTVIEPKPSAAWGRYYERVAPETLKAKPARAVEAPPVEPCEQVVSDDNEYALAMAKLNRIQRKAKRLMAKLKRWFP